MALDENTRAANALLDDFIRVHNRIHRQKRTDHSGKQPKRTTPPVNVWRADEEETHVDAESIFRSSTDQKAIT